MATQDPERDAGDERATEAAIDTPSASLGPPVEAVREPEVATGAVSVPLGAPQADVVEPVAGDIERKQERVREHVTYIAVGLLVVTVVTLLLAVVSGLRTWNDLQGMSSAVLPAVLGVVGTVLGFYFGSQSNKNSTR